MNTTDITPIAPRRPFRILRDPEMFDQVAVFYRTREARDTAAQMYADKTGTTVLAELWSVDGVHDDMNRGWGCDGVFTPSVQVTLTLHIENDYELGGMVVTTPTVTVPAPPDRADEKAHELWEYNHIFCATGAERTGGDAAYFVTVDESDRPDLIAVGTEYEFGV